MALPPNFIARPYRGVSVLRWEGPLERAAVEEHLRGREVYRRTEFIVVRAAGGSALVRVEKQLEEPLFSPVLRTEWLAGPGECDDSVAPDADTAIATDLAAAARQRPAGRRVYVVEGLYHHVNFIWEPQPVLIRVLEVVPPEPPKLVDMARRVLSVDEELPPVELVADLVDIRKLARDHPADRYLLPCRGSDIDLPASVDFLDERPQCQPGWTLIGCERSRQLYQWFYGSQPQRVELCPRALAGPGEPVLGKCCLLERGIEQTPEGCFVPWGATLDEVRRALRLLSVPTQPDC
jgi:hypothetical protein